jgi:FkbM family methyltransferase
MKVYFEAGANDGVFQSCTQKYQKDDEWVGILVEPDPRCYNGLKCRENERTYIYHYALVEDPNISEVELCQHNSPAMNMLKDCETAKRYKNLKTVKVSAITLQALLDKAPVDHIDEFYLDTEGYELSILRGLREFDIRYAQIELHYQTGDRAKKERDDITAEMVRLGLQFKTFDKDTRKIEFEKCQNT